MASYHHGHPNPAAASCCGPNTCCCHPPPPPPHHPPPPPQQTQIYPCYQSQLDLYHRLELESQGHPPPLPPIHHSHQQFIHMRRNPTPQETSPSVSSLVRRIAALESSLLRLRLSSAPAWSLRDIAARMIQMHFRAFLARRSRTLGQLKQLASIKSAFHSLKASTTSGNAQIDPQSIFRKTTVLHQKLEFIQSGDPMIRDGKRSIYRELIRFKDLIDRIYFKRAARSNQHRGNNSRVFSRVDAGDLSEDENEFRGRPSGIANKSHRFMGDEEGFDIGVLPVKGGSSHRRSGGLLKRAGGGGGEGRVKKTVTFADDGKLYRATIATPERNSSGEEEEEEEEGDEIELLDNLGRKVEEIGGSEDEDGAEGEEEEEEDFVFSAPLPVKMDRRDAAADLMKKMKRDAGNENR